MNAVSLQPRLAHTVNFSPRLQHAVRLLQLSTLDYAQALREAALDNPFLDVEGSEPTPTPTPYDHAMDVDANVAWARGLDRMDGPGASSRRHLPHDQNMDLLQQTPARTGL
ncbi:MAG TPA: hypothetical protein VMR43_02760, partial [Variovorax sp.]|nr:hypothetical protein [Variovorax sp.]